MKVLVAGDVHGDTFACNKLNEYASQHQCQYVLQLGDFCLTDRVSEFLNVVNKGAQQNNVTWLITPGNHEKYDYLKSVYQASDPDGPFAEARNRIFFIKRGAFFTLGPVNFVSIGGSFSVDYAARTEGKDWWKDELITPEDVLACFQHVDKRVDVLLTHDTGHIPKVLEKEFFRFKLRPGSEQICKDQRSKIDTVIKTLQPGIVFHGHYHRRVSYYIHHIRVEGMHCGTILNQNWMVVDLSVLYEFCQSKKDPRRKI
jgi:predicted phosphodiesterase